MKPRRVGERTVDTVGNVHRCGEEGSGYEERTSSCEREARENMRAKTSKGGDSGRAAGTAREGVEKPPRSGNTG